MNQRNDYLGRVSGYVIHLDGPGRHRQSSGVTWMLLAMGWVVGFAMGMVAGAWLRS
jgi:hypothetical protein